VQGADTTVVPTAVVVVQTELGMVTGTVVGTVGTVTPGGVTVGRGGSVGTVKFAGGLPLEPPVLLEPPDADADEGAGGAAPAGECWAGVLVDPVLCVEADPVVPAAGVLAPVFATTGCKAGAG
jgi:hypothetical protein